MSNQVAGLVFTLLCVQSVFLVGAVFDVDKVTGRLASLVGLILGAVAVVLILRGGN